MSEQVTHSEYLYRGRILKLRLDQVRLEGERERVAVREIVEHPGACVIVALDEQEVVLLVRQYRAAVARELLELPAGTLEEGENPALCAIRELGEETGYQASQWDLLGYIYSSPGISTEKMYLYLARNLTQAKANPEEDEEITVERVPLAEAIEMIERGEIVDSKSIVGLLRTWRKIKESGKSQ